LAARLGAPYVELDSIYHQRDWTPLPSEEFVARVTEIASGDGWVIDGNYGAVRPLVWARADTVVWVDPPRHLVMRRILWRTVSRGVMRRELWNGNRESLRNLLSATRTSTSSSGWRSHRKYASATRRPPPTRRTSACTSSGSPPLPTRHAARRPSR